MPRGLEAARPELAAPQVRAVEVEMRLARQGVAAATSVLAAHREAEVVTAVQEGRSGAAMAAQAAQTARRGAAVAIPARMAAREQAREPHQRPFARQKLFGRCELRRRW